MALQLRLPQDNILRLRDILEVWASKKSCTRKELESFVGHLSHAALVIHPGRTFLRQLFSLLPLANKPHHKVRLNCSVRADIRWWQCFLQDWNGTFFVSPSFPTTQVFSDASCSYGCGAFVVNGPWFQFQWPQAWEQIDISIKELIPIIAAAAVWGPNWCKQHICFNSDNLAVVSILNTKAPRDPHLCHSLRTLFFYSAQYSFSYSARHLPGRENSTADALSRNSAYLFPFFTQVPQTNIPPPILDLLLELSLDWESLQWTSKFSASLAIVSPPPR